MAVESNFQKVLNENELLLSRISVDTIQINLGKLCNQVCTHCHVDAGPHKKKENMGEDVFSRIVTLIENTPSVTTIDLTGGAPEMNPFFRPLVLKLRAMGKKVLDRCNLTILSEEGYEDLADFLKENSVDVVASLPCYDFENVDSQRGDGVFEKSIAGLKKLNALGYGRPGSGLKLNLVYNPNGAFLSPDQTSLEAMYKEQLSKNFDIVFNDLYALNNVPIKRYLYQLVKEKKYDEYMQLLLDNFNAAAIDGLMCKYSLSLSWDGEIFDCDFNQVLVMKTETRKNIWQIENFNQFLGDNIQTANHCFACSAGAGSSCHGATS